MSPAGSLETSDAFRVTTPAGGETPVVVEVPHAGLLLDGIALASLVAPARSLARDADLYADELVEGVVEEGATCLVARTSRYFVDLNRAEHEHDALAVEGSRGPDAPHGVVWHRTTDGDRAISGPLPRTELERRLELVHRPYHATLGDLLVRKREKFGHAILVCAHTMPSTGLGPGGREIPRADVVPGTRGRTSAAAKLIDVLEAHARTHGLSVRHDDPYRGGFSTGHYGRPREGFHALQIEVARRLYMNERTFSRLPEGVARLRKFYRELVATLASLNPGR